MFRMPFSATFEKSSCAMTSHRIFPDHPHSGRQTGFTINNDIYEVDQNTTPSRVLHLILSALHEEYGDDAMTQSSVFRSSMKVKKHRWTSTRRMI